MWKRRVTLIRPALHLAAYTLRNDLRGVHAYAYATCMCACVCTGSAVPLPCRHTVFSALGFMELFWRGRGVYVMYHHGLHNALVQSSFFSRFARGRYMIKMTSACRALCRSRSRARWCRRILSRGTLASVCLGCGRLRTIL